jgi:hypothetical protein
MAVRIEDNFMAFEVNGALMATAWFNNDAAGGGKGPWIVSTHTTRLSYRNQAVTALCSPSA